MKAIVIIVFFGFSFSLDTDDSVRYTRTYCINDKKNLLDIIIETKSDQDCEMSIPKTDNGKRMAFKLEIKIISDKNNEFSLISSADNYSYLNIKAIQKNDLFNKSFSNKFTVDKVKENKYFLMFEDLKEICDELSERIKTKEMKLIENANNLIFIIYLPSAKRKEIKFELNEDQKNDKDKIKDLNELIIKLNNEMNKLKNENQKEIDGLKYNFNKGINDLKNIIDNQNKEIKELNKENSENKKEINELKNIINNQNNEINELKKQMKLWLKINEAKEMILKNSLIINNNIEYNKLIKNWINPDKKIEGELLYRLSRDGDQFSYLKQ